MSADVRVASGAELAFDDHGAGEAVLLIHGHPFNRTMWRFQYEALSARGFRVIAPDLRGYGESAPLGTRVTMRQFAEDIVDLLDELQVAYIAVVGLSMGGLVAMEMAMGWPERVSALGLVATTAQAVSTDERETRLALADRLDAGEGLDDLLATMREKSFGSNPTSQLVADVEAMMKTTSAGGAAAALRGRTERPDYRPLLSRLRMPIFVCVGDEDVFSTREVTEELVGSLRSCELVEIAGVGHLPNLEAPEAFNVALLRFLERRPRAKSRT